jgi:ATP-dependent RNA helicase DDX3X
MIAARYMVLDEADDLLDAEHEESLQRLRYGGDANIDGDMRMLMFSATFSDEAREIARQYLGEGHTLISVGRIGSSHGNIQHEIIEVNRDEREDKLYELLADDSNLRRSIVFVNHKNTAEILDAFLFSKGLPVICTHSGRPQEQRELAL